MQVSCKLCRRSRRLGMSELVWRSGASTPLPSPSSLSVCLNDRRYPSSIDDYKFYNGAVKVDGGARRDGGKCTLATASPAASPLIHTTLQWYISLVTAVSRQREYDWRGWNTTSLATWSRLRHWRWLAAAPKSFSMTSRRGNQRPLKCILLPLPIQFLA